MLKDQKPCKGKGVKRSDCQFYEKCLDHASENDWAAFNCEGCSPFKAGSVKVKTPEKAEKKLCKDCGVKPVLHPNLHHCSSCLNNRKRNKDSKTKNAGNAKIKTKRPRGRPPKKAARDMPKVEKAPKTANGAVTIDFGKYISVLKEVEKVADREMRPVGLQIAWMLQQQLNSTGR